MSHSLSVSQTSKEEKYIELLPQIKSLLAGETDLVANLGNVSAALKQVFGFFWVGFYLVKDEELVLGPFQGTIACTRIKYGKGVCGTAWKESRTIVVEDVSQFPGHIACDAASQSEIVIPLFKDGKVIGVLDVDSDQLAEFDEVDTRYLEQVVELLNI